MAEHDEASARFQLQPRSGDFTVEESWTDRLVVDPWVEALTCSALHG